MPLRRFPTSSGSLYYGPMPTEKDLRLIKKNKIDVIWNLAKELGHVADIEKTIVPNVIEGNVQDFSVPSNMNLFMAQVNQVAAFLRAGKKVFVHCHGGRGRTGLALAALKIALDKVDAKKALKLVKTLVNGPDTQEQKEFIEFYAPFLGGEKSAEEELPKFPTKPKYQEYDWTKYRNMDWDKYMKQNLPQKKLRVEFPPCHFCNDPNVVSEQKWAGQKMYLCRVCNDIWSHASDEEKDSWMKD